MPKILLLMSFVVGPHLRPICRLPFFINFFLSFVCQRLKASFLPRRRPLVGVSRGVEERAHVRLPPPRHVDHQHACKYVQKMI